MDSRLLGALMASLLSTPHFCDHCKKETKFLPVCTAIALTGVSRSTIYYWMEHQWIHWRELPSGRRLICEASLSRPVHEDSPPSSHHIEKYSKIARNCPKPSNAVG